MSKTTTETKITPQYLAGRTKDQLINLCNLLVRENVELSHAHEPCHVASTTPDSGIVGVRAKKKAGRPRLDPSGERRDQSLNFLTPTEKATLYSLLIQTRKQETKP